MRMISINRKFDAIFWKYKSFFGCTNHWNLLELLLYRRPTLIWHAVDTIVKILEIDNEKFNFSSKKMKNIVHICHCLCLNRKRRIHYVIRRILADRTHIFAYKIQQTSHICNSSTNMATRCLSCTDIVTQSLAHLSYGRGENQRKKAEPAKINEPNIQISHSQKKNTDIENERQKKRAGDMAHQMHTHTWYLFVVNDSPINIYCMAHIYHAILLLMLFNIWFLDEILCFVFGIRRHAFPLSPFLSTLHVSAMSKFINADLSSTFTVVVVVVWRDSDFKFTYPNPCCLLFVFHFVLCICKAEFYPILRVFSGILQPKLTFTLDIVVV